MFVPVSCTNCGKPFQIPESALGQRAPCPWCQAVVTALPVSAPIPQTQHPPAPAPAQEPQPQSQPLSLDDDPPAPLPATPVKPPVATLPREAASPPASRPWILLLMLAIGGGVVVAMMAATLIFLGYGRGSVATGGWQEFAPPDGSFTISLPGTPREEDTSADPGSSIGSGKRYVVHGWYSKTAVWVAYNDLDPALVQKLPLDKDRVLAAGVLRAERDRERNRLQGTITKEAEVRMNSAWGVEVHMDTPSGTVIEWLLLMGAGSRPRLYVFGVEGKNIAPESAPCRKLFSSFRVNE